MPPSPGTRGSFESAMLNCIKQIHTNSILKATYKTLPNFGVRWAGMMYGPTYRSYLVGTYRHINNNFDSFFCTTK